MVNNIDFSRADVSYTMNEATKGGMNSDEDYISANQVLKSPGGILPDGINAISNCYWQLGTTLRSFKTAVTLKLNDIEGISNPANLRILKRVNASAQWVVYSDFSPASVSEITANNVYEFSDKFVGENGKQTYRLKQVDTDGTYSYSSEVNVELQNPLKYSLMQNYPNPFNPATTIEYNLPEASHIEIVLYDLLGCKVTVIEDTDQEAGTHRVLFNAGLLPSGIYVYTMMAVSKDGSKIFSESKRLTLMK